MSDPKTTGIGMGDIISSTKQRLEQSDSPAERLRAHMASGIAGKPIAPTEPSKAVDSTALPGNYFPQVPTDTRPVPKKLPQRGPARSQQISMRLSVVERDRLVKWCENRNLSLADGIVALLDAAEEHRV